MSIETSIPGCSSQSLVVLECYVPSGLWIFEALGKAEVNDVEQMLLVLDSYQEVVGFNVSVQEAIHMNILYTLQHLDRQHQHRFVGELASTVLEKVL